MSEHELAENKKDTKIKGRTINKKEFKLFNIKRDNIDYKIINYSIFILTTLTVIVLSIFILTQISDIILAPLSNFFSMLTPFIIGIVLAWLLTPIVEKIQETRNISRRKASLIVSIVGILSITLMIVGFVYAATDTLVTFLSGNNNLWYYLTTGMTELTNDIQVNLNSSNDSAMSLFRWIGEQLGLISQNSDGDYILEFVIHAPTEYIGSFFSFLYQYVIIATVALFLLPEFRGLNKVFKNSIPKKYKSHGSDLIDIVAESFTAYMNGALKIASMIGIAVFIGLSTITIVANFILPEAYSGATGTLIIVDPSQAISIILIILVFSILASVTNLVPYIGPFIGGTPIVILVFLTDRSLNNWITISVLILIIFVQSFESMFLQPVIMGRSTRIHPVLILMGLTIFGSLFGLVGLLISTPVLAISKSVIKYYDDIYEIF